MTEQIIIDGVDVSGCEFYEDGFCTLSNDRNERLPFCEKCTGYSDCLYERFQRKTAECKNNETAYKNDLEILNQACADLKNELDNKTEECEGLNCIIDRLLAAGGYNQTTSDAEDFEEIYEDLEYKIEKLQELENKLKIAIEALKNLEKNLCKNCDWQGTGCDNNCRSIKIQQALDQIGAEALKTIAEIDDCDN